MLIIKYLILFIQLVINIPNSFFCPKSPPLLTGMNVAQNTHIVHCQIQPNICGWMYSLVKVLLTLNIKRGHFCHIKRGQF